MREYGISLICLDQHISKLSDTVAGNSACHIAFQQQLPQDIRDISSLMQLFDKKEIFSQIPVGSAIVKLSERYNFPFLIKSPFIDLDKVSVNDEKIKSRSECALENLNARKDEEFIKKYPVEEKIEEKKEIKIEKNESKEELNPKQKILYSFINKKIEEGRTLLQIEHILEKGLHEKLYSETDILKATNFALKNQFKKFPKKIEEDNKLQNKSIINVKNLNEEEKKFLNFLEKNPCHNYSTVELYNKMGFSSRKGNNIKKSLMEKDLIKIEEFRDPKGWKKFIKLK